MAKTERERLTLAGVLASLGPGLVWAAAAVGVSHLVQSTRAGASYGFALVWVVILANVLKYPFFEYGPRYAAATGESLVDGYRRQGRWAVWAYFFLTLGTMFAVLAAVTFVTGGLATQLFGEALSPFAYSAVVLAVCAVVLVPGQYPLLDKLVKAIMALLAVSTVAAVAAAALAGEGRAAAGPAAELDLLGPATFPFLIALVGWMPSAIDISVWHSLWTLERAKETKHRPLLREALFDFNLGYAGTAVLALLFLSLGALVFHGSGQEVAESPAGFAYQLFDLYTAALGPWARPIIVVAAFTTMFSTTLTVADAFPRALQRTTEILAPRLSGGPAGAGAEGRRSPVLYWGWMLVLVAGALLLMSVFRSSLTGMVDFATTLSFLTSPFLGYLNSGAVTAPPVRAAARPPGWLRALTWIGLAFGVVFGVVFLAGRFLTAEPEEPAPPTEAVAAAVSAAELPETGAAAGANLLLVTLDTTRADRLGSYGAADAATPNLDRLAERGLRFVDAVSPVPMTLPAHATVMTGLDPPAHAVRVNGEAPLAAEHETLAEALAGAGYRTGAFVSSFVLDPRFGLGQGFGTYDATLEATRAAALEPQVERGASSVTTAALGWLAERGEAEAGFFLWVHYFDPHDPYEPPEPFASRFRDRPYDGEIAYVDSELGRLLDAVPPDTLIVVAGDHGESLGEHGERYHSRTLYEGAVRVPLIVALPDRGHGGDGGAGGAVDGFVVTLSDLYPTLLDLLGVPIDEAARRRLDGRSLVAAPAGDGRSRLAERTVYLETLNPWYDNGWAPLYAARTHERKYVRAPRPELYDLGSDPGETRNLLAEEGSAGSSAEALRRFLDRRSPNDLGAELAAVGGGEVDPEVRRRLESLGYLTAGGASESRAGGDPAVPYDELPDPKEMLPLLEELAEGRRALAAGRPAEAERSARRILAGAPRDRSALQLLAESYATRGRVEDAERALHRSVEIGPTIGACVLLAQVVLQQGRFDEAEALLDRAAEIDPRHGAISIGRGDLALVQGRPEDALALYRQAAENDRHRFAGLAEARIERVRAARSNDGSP